jgi:MurNAc alpha-1-phosphate uridylyltransferase
MAPLTDTRPKPLVHVAGKPLLDHARAQCGGLNVVVNAHYFADQIYDHLDGTGVAVSDETGTLLETGGGLRRALPLLGTEPVFTMNTDAVWHGANPLDQLRKSWDPSTMEALLLMIHKPNAIGHSGAGDFNIDAEGRLSRGNEYVYSGAQIIRTDGLADVKEDAFSMWELWTGMLGRCGMFGVAYDGKWCDVGRPESIPIAEAMLRNGQNV